MKKSRWIYLGLFLFALILLLKGIYLKQLGYDEAIHLNVAQNLARFGKPVFYESCYHYTRIGFEHPFLYLWVLVLAEKLSQNLFIMRLIIFSLISIPLIVAVFYFTSKFFNREAAYLAVIFLVFSRYFQIHSGNFLLDLASSLFLFLGISLYILSMERKSLLLLTLGALASAIAICFKESALLILPIIIAHYLFVRFIKKRKGYLKYFLTYSLLLSFFIIIYLIYSKNVGAGILTPFYNSNERFLFIKTPWKYIPILKYLSIFLFKMGVLPVTLALAFIFTSKYEKDKEILLISAIAISFIFFSVILERSDRYYVILLPELMVLAGAEAVRFLKKPNKILAVIFAIALIINIYTIAVYSKETLSSQPYKSIYKEIGLKIKEINTTKAFLANNGPVISYYAGNLHYYLPFLYNYTTLMNMLDTKRFINVVVLKPDDWLPFFNRTERKEYSNYLKEHFKVFLKTKYYTIFVR